MSPRAVKEWIGKTHETAVPPRVKARIALSQDGICACGCGVKLGMAAEPTEFDHTEALINGGENRESNLRALRQGCHKAKTREDVAQKSTDARKRNRHMGFKAPSKNPLPGGRNSNLKKKVGGQVVARD